MSEIGQEFQVFVSQSLDQPTQWGKRLRTRLPAYLSQSFAPHHIEVGEHRVLAILLKDEEHLPPKRLQKQLQQLLKHLDAQEMNFCLVAEELSPYLRRRLVQLRIPFVIPNKQLYWPQMGYIQSRQRTPRLKPKAVELLSPASQLFFLALLLDKMPGVRNLTEAAQYLELTKMSLSRAIKELQAANLVDTNRQGRNRIFELRNDAQNSWEQAQNSLRDPVIRRLRIALTSLPKEIKTLAGESALAQQSDLIAPEEPVFAIANRTWNQKYRDVPTVPIQDEGTCVIELWRYSPGTLSSESLTDPLSTYLSLRDSEDPRIQTAVEDILGRLKW